MWRVKEFYEPEDFPKEEQKAENIENTSTECPQRSGSLPTGEGGGRGRYCIRIGFSNSSFHFFSHSNQASLLLNPKLSMWEVAVNQ